MDVTVLEAEAEPQRSPTVRATPELWHHLGIPALFAALALGFRQDLLFLLGALVVGCALAAAPLCRRNLRGVSVRRRVPARARAGTPTTLEVEVSNDGSGAAVGLEIEQGHPRLAWPAQGRVDVPCLSAGRSARGHLEITFAARGRHELEAPRLSSRFPLGAFRASLPVGAPQAVLVWPREGRPSAALLQRLRGAGDQAQLRRPLARGADDLFGVREQREGDDPRRVHWPSSARRGETLVTDWRALEGHEILVVLGRCAGHPQGLLFERAVSIAATLWRVLERERLRGRLLVGGQSVAASGRGLAAGLDLLALARPRATSAASLTLRGLAGRPRPRHIVVVGGPEDQALLGEARAAAGPRGRAWLLDARSGHAQRWVEGLDA